MFTRQNIIKIDDQEHSLNVHGKSKRQADSIIDSFKRSLRDTGVKAEFIHTPDPLW